MNEITNIELVLSGMCFGHFFISVLCWLEDIRTAIALGQKHQTTIPFTTIAAFIFSVCVVIRRFVL